MGSERRCFTCRRRLDGTGDPEHATVCSSCEERWRIKCQPPTPTGWLCPACGRGNAPSTGTCPCCGEWRLSIEGRRSNDIKTKGLEPMPESAKGEPQEMGNPHNDVWQIVPSSPLQTHTTCPKCQHGARYISDHTDKLGWLCCDRCGHSWDAHGTEKPPCPKCKHPLRLINGGGIISDFHSCGHCSHLWDADPEKVCSPVQTGETGKASPTFVRRGWTCPCCGTCNRAGAMECDGLICKAVYIENVNSTEGQARLKQIVDQYGSTPWTHPAP